MERLWYAAYGSNLSSARFAAYLGGGQPAGAARHYAGARDRSEPLAAVPLMLPGQVYFAWESPTWSGGIAFYDPEPEGVVAARAYLVTAQQLSDVVSQEMRRPVGRDLPLAELFAQSRTAVLGPGRYETLHLVQTHDGLPVVTFTASWEHRTTALNAPSPAYVRTIAAGLAEAHGWDLPAVCDYLLARPGVAPTWDRARLLAQLPQPDGFGRSQPAEAPWTP